MDIVASKLSIYGKEKCDMIFAAPYAERMPILTSLAKKESERATAIWLAKEIDMPFLENFQYDPKPAKKIPHEYFSRYCCITIKDEGDPTKLCLISGWPLEDNVCKQIQMFTGKRPEIFLGNRDEILHEIEVQFGFEGEGGVEEPEKEVEEVASEDDEAAVVKFVNDILRRGLRSRATDIHFEPQRYRLRIRYRIDGDLVEVRVPEGLAKFKDAITSRVKIMSSLNISEKRRPQDGKMSFNDGKTKIDVRVSTLPIVYGESISLRLLVQGRDAPVSIKGLDMNDYQFGITERALSKPHGIILVTGPTGSGKSTTTSSFLRHVSTPTVRLITAEDPVEYDIEGANQSQVNAEIGLTFAAILRSMLRQDPDVIMLGEIRDSETGDIAVRAAVTGHLVLSTLHTNDAVGSITRLRDIGIPSYMVASALEMVCAQRLVRRLCPHCAKLSEKYNKPDELQKLQKLLQIPKLPDEVKLMEPVGCEHCNGIGYRGRMAVFEILGMNEKIHEAVVNDAKESEIRQIALDEGMTFLAQDAFMRACRGLTTVDEAIQLIP